MLLKAYVCVETVSGVRLESGDPWMVRAIFGFSGLSLHSIWRRELKLLVTSATLVVTGALLVVTKKLLELNQNKSKNSSIDQRLQCPCNVLQWITHFAVFLSGTWHTAMCRRSFAATLWRYSLHTGWRGVYPTASGAHQWSLPSHLRSLPTCCDITCCFS